MRHGEGASQPRNEDDPYLSLIYSSMSEYVAWEQAWCTCVDLCTCDA